MKALTVKQPWAWAICYGYKTVENRTRPTNYRGRVAIHAGKAWSNEGADDRRIFEAAVLAAQNLTIGVFLILCGDRKILPRGAIMGTVEIVGCHPATPDCGCVWGDPGVYHWELANHRLLDEFVPAKGALGLWNADYDEPQERLRTGMSDADTARARRR